MPGALAVTGAGVVGRDLGRVVPERRLPPLAALVRVADDWAEAGYEADLHVLARCGSRASTRADPKPGMPRSIMSSLPVRLMRNQPGVSTIVPGRTSTL